MNWSATQAASGASDYLLVGDPISDWWSGDLTIDHIKRETNSAFTDNF